MRHILTIMTAAVFVFTTAVFACAEEKEKNGDPIDSTCKKIVE